MSLSVQGIHKKNEVPTREQVVFPLQRGTCKKCGKTYWWGKMNGRGKFYPPFATQEATHWHVCEKTHKAVILDDTDEADISIKEMQTIVEKNKHKLKKSDSTNTNYTGRSISTLIADIQALSTTLKDYGRPHV